MLPHRNTLVADTPGLCVLFFVFVMHVDKLEDEHVSYLAVEDEVLDRLGHEDDVAHPAHDDWEVARVKHPEP